MKQNKPIQSFISLITATLSVLISIIFLVLIVKFMQLTNRVDLNVLTDHEIEKITVIYTDDSGTYKKTITISTSQQISSKHEINKK